MSNEFVTVGSIWFLVAVSTWVVGNRRQIQSELLRLLQWIYLILALAVLAPQLGVGRTVIGVMWLVMVGSALALGRKLRLPVYGLFPLCAVVVLFTYWGSNSLLGIGLRTLAITVLSWIFLLGLIVGPHYTLHRLWRIIPVLFAITAITFLMMHSVPGGPFDAGGETGGIPLTPEVRANLMRKYHLDKPLPEQYVTWLWNVVHGDFGFSFQIQNATCQELLARAWPVSAHLGGMTLLVAVMGGLTLGILAARFQNTWIDHFSSLVAIFGIVTPPFVVAVGLILIFSLGLHWFDTGGWTEPKHWVMPVFALSLGPLAIIQRYTRASMIDAIRADYIRTARAKGLSERTVLLVHVLKNALIPLLTIAGPMTANLITGSFFIETIFRIPGIGKYFTTSVFARDYPMIMANALLWGTLIVVAYLLTDLLYALVDPRIRYAKRGR